MRNQILIYILFAACFFSACQSEYYDFDSETDDIKKEISLTVAANDIVVSDGIASRAEHYGPSTVFKEADCVGLIILDKDGNLLADNVPYKFDGTGWAFDADNKYGKERVYYDETMTNYIVYYPYDSSANGVKAVSALKELSAFEVQEDQSSKDNYRSSDLMIWTYEGKAQRELPVELKHVHNSLSLDVKLRWSLRLPNDDVLEYHPLRVALVDFIVCDEGDTIIFNNDIDKTFQAQDGTYRYILPDKGYDRKVTWRYTYRGESFGGECNVSANAAGVRYVQHTSADISPDKVEPYDYYSCKMINGECYGFVLPWDAEECFNQYHPIGIVFYVGHHDRDESDYSDSGIAQNKCHGYIVALTDALLDKNSPTNWKIAWAVRDTQGAKNYVTVEKYNSEFDTNAWSGYKNMNMIRAFSGSTDEVDESVFPAARAAELYVGPNKEMGHTLNTSGWFIPTLSMLTYILSDKNLNESFKAIADISLLKFDSFFDIADLDGYWTSTEGIAKDYAYYKSANPTDVASKTQNYKYILRYVRCVLAF